MELDQYFRIPAAQRLTRRELANRLNAMGHEITPEAVGNWVRANKVPPRWVSLVESVLNLDETAVKKPAIKISSTDK